MIADIDDHHLVRCLLAVISLNHPREKSRALAFTDMESSLVFWRKHQKRRFLELHNSLPLFECLPHIYNRWLVCILAFPYGFTLSALYASCPRCLFCLWLYDLLTTVNCDVLRTLFHVGKAIVLFWLWGIREKWDWVRPSELRRERR